MFTMLFFKSKSSRFDVTPLIFQKMWFIFSGSFASFPLSKYSNLDVEKIKDKKTKLQNRYQYRWIVLINLVVFGVPILYFIWENLPNTQAIGKLLFFGKWIIVSNDISWAGCDWGVGEGGEWGASLPCSHNIDHPEARRGDEKRATCDYCLCSKPSLIAAWSCPLLPFTP